MANYRNEFEFRSGLLDALGVEHSEADAKNEERWRAKMLDGLEVEYNQNDVNQFDLFRAKLVEGVEAKAEGGGGGSSDFSTAEVTFISVSDTYGANATTVDNDSIKHETYEVTPQNPVTVTVPLYKGKNIMPITCIQGNDQSYMPTTEGSIVFDLDSLGYIVIGNGSITAKGRSIG